MQFFLFRYFKNIKNHNVFTYIIELTIIALIGKVFFSILTEYFLSLLNNVEVYNTSIDLQTPKITIDDFILVVIFAPILETFVGQWLFIKIASFFSKRFAFQIWFSALLFSLLHLPSIGFLPGAFFIGIILAYAFVQKRNEKNSWYAFYLVAAIHSLHNLLAFAFTFFADSDIDVNYIVSTLQKLIK